MARKYFVLLSKDGVDDNWLIDFGAFDREDVVAEKADRRDHGWKASELKIITVTNARQATIDAAVAALNA